MADAFGDNAVGRTVQPCPLAQKKQLHWVEIQVIGEDDMPVSFQEFRVTLPEGKEVKGYVDQNGFARLDGIESGGACKFTFPQLDSDAWQKTG